MKRKAIGAVLVLIGAAFMAAALLLVGEAVAQTSASDAQPVYSSSPNAGTGLPLPRQITLQNPVTPVAASINWFHSYVNVIIIAIALFVLALLVFVVLRFNEKSNPTPSKTTHHTGLEVAWTVLPIFILIAIAIPSFRLLYFQYSFPKPDLTIKAIGNAWFWEHEYPDEKVKVTSNMLTDTDLLKADIGETEFNRRFDAKANNWTELQRIKAVQDAAAPIWAGTKKVASLGEGSLVRQLSVDNDIAVPVGKVVHMLVTSNDVIHSWTIPSFGSKIQAVPGRITATWFRADKIGVYYGQCSVLCGKQHSGMPIAIRVVSDKAYADWLAAAKARDWKRARGILQAATADLTPKTVAELAPAATAN